GVFGMWYGKGPGVDRCGDVFKHANAAGTAKHGGVLVLAGDDHAAKSSTLPHQSEHIFKACLIPHLNPSNVQDYLDLGLHGYAMSRYSGCWVAFKCVTDVVESGASVVVDPNRVNVKIPADFALPGDGLEEILVVEEKRQVIEYQIKEELYNWKEGVRVPRVVGKFDDSGEWSRSGGSPAGTWLLPAHYEHSPGMVARAIAQRLEKLNM